MSPGWPLRPLGDLVEVLDHKRVPVSAAERAKRPGDVPYYGAAGQVGTIDKALFDGPLLLLGEDGVQFFDRHKAKAYLVDGPSWVNNHAHVLRAGHDIERRWLLHILNAFDYDGYANGTTRLKLTKSRMCAIPVPVPPLGEQNRIIAILEAHLSRLDAGHAALRLAERRNQRLGTASIESALLPAVDGATASARRSVVEDSGALPALPPGWQWSRLADVAYVVGGLTKDASKQSGQDHVEVPYLRVANVQRGRLDLTTLKTIRAPASKVEQLRLRPGDVLMNEGGDRDKLGRGWVWTDGPDPCIHQNHVYRARSKGGLRPELLSWWANTIGGEWCERHGRQSVNLASISLSRIRQMPVPVPPWADQQRLQPQITDVAATRDRLSQDLASSARQGAALRRTLLSAALTGNL